VGLISYSMDQERRSAVEAKTIFHHDESANKIIIERTQDVRPILQENKEKRNVDDGYTRDRSMKRVAQIPLIIVEKWLKEEGWNALDQNESERLMQKLDDPDWSYLKTSDGKHARTAKREYFRGSCTTKPVYLGDKL
jgi:hypothetical protein